MNNYTKESIVRLIQAAKKSVDILIEEIERPLDREELQDDKARNAAKAKRECFEDCQEILLGIKNLEDRIKDGQSLIEDKKDFKGSFAEKYARK